MMRFFICIAGINPMEKRHYSPIDLIKIASQHAYCADNLLHLEKTSNHESLDLQDKLFPVISLIYTAFELTLKAYYLHYHGLIKPVKNLVELLEINDELVLSKKEVDLVKNLSYQHAFHKGVAYDLWQDGQQMHIFCYDIIALYERLQTMMPVGLQPDYQ